MGTEMIFGYGVGYTHLSQLRTDGLNIDEMSPEPILFYTILWCN